MWIAELLLPVPYGLSEPKLTLNHYFLSNVDAMHDIAILTAILMVLQDL